MLVCTKAGFKFVGVGVRWLGSMRWNDGGPAAGFLPGVSRPRDAVARQRAVRLPQSRDMGSGAWLDRVLVSSRLRR